MTQDINRKHRYPILVITLLVISSLACGLLTTAIESLTGEESASQSELISPNTGIELLFEMLPFGTVEERNKLHTLRWQFYASDASVDDMGDFYIDDLAGWQVEKDEVVNGHRHLVLNSNHRLSSIYSEADFRRVISANADLLAGLLDVEVLNATAHRGVGRLQSIDPQLLPDATIIIIVDYLYHKVQASPTPVLETPEAGDLNQTCQLALESGLCANSYFPPIEGLLLVYSIDGHRTQTRQINMVERGVQAPGEPPMDRFTVTFIDDHINIDLEYLCTEEGISGGDMGRMMVSVLEGQDMGGETVSVESMTFEGVTLPHDISPGDTWEAFVEVVLSAPEGVKLIATNNARYRFVGYETVTVAAGTFETQKIITEMDVDVGALLPDGHFMALTSSQITMVSYNAECIGMVMSESDMNLELVDIIMP